MPAVFKPIDRSHLITTHHRARDPIALGRLASQTLANIAIVFPNAQVRGAKASGAGAGTTWALELTLIDSIMMPDPAVELPAARAQLRFLETQDSEINMNLQVANLLTALLVEFPILMFDVTIYDVLETGSSDGATWLIGLLFDVKPTTPPAPPAIVGGVATPAAAPAPAAPAAPSAMARASSALGLPPGLMRGVSRGPFAGTPAAAPARSAMDVLTGGAGSIAAESFAGQTPPQTPLDALRADAARRLDAARGDAAREVTAAREAQTAAEIAADQMGQELDAARAELARLKAQQGGTSGSGT